MYNYDPNILQDAWTINLRDKGKNMNQTAFDYLDKVTKEWEKNNMKQVDVGEELKDLLKIYTDAEAKLKQKEQLSISALNLYMRTYLAVVDERVKMSEKLSELANKINLQDNEECDEEE